MPGGGTELLLLLSWSVERSALICIGRSEPTAQWSEQNRVDPATLVDKQTLYKCCDSVHRCALAESQSLREHNKLRIHKGNCVAQK